ncbi:type I polyketide synthase [Trueperella bernardiae]|uniref:type I polyketide synthase n=1 Tax=Trueperella bernardiae TaxID=59561 RepID=UPI000C7D536C|nr:type I polyketide synthase [Trueperella bernardiae]PKZ89650.1 type I polyketide synthase [Trueperella bernardiae]
MYEIHDPYVLQFAGQATPWRAALAEAAEDPAIRDTLERLQARAEELLASVLPELTRICAGPLDLLATTSGEAFASVPGILLAQYGSYLDLPLGAQPQAVVGHSQGVLAVHMLASEHKAHVLALARLIGAAATQATRAEGASRFGELTPMLAVRDVPERVLSEVAARHGAQIAIRNTATSFTLAGLPASLEAVRRDLDALASAEAKARTEKTIGGAALTPITEFLDVSAPFHSALLAPALEQVLAWVRACGWAEDATDPIDMHDVERLAAAVLTDRLDWDSVFAEATKGVGWVVDLGPGTGLARITRDNARGRGIGVVNAGSADARDALATKDAWVPGEDWSAFAPKLAMIDDGRVVVDTRFTRLTGRAPVLLAGMTPTTVEPEIVAAAANAGYWVEMAGGGQVTEEVFEKNLAGLVAGLEEGRTAQFNAMFMDRYLWNLQFGTQHIVSRNRQSGAPLDGVVISAGIPETEEGVELVERLRGEGFTYVAFKPGTIGQIRQVLKIARATTAPILIMVEDGHAGGHHSWEDLDQLLLDTYAEIRAQDNTVLIVGGGLGVPERAAGFLTGTWALEHGPVPMPVDAIMIGTAAMTAREAKTNDDVKQLLVDTAGVPVDRNAGWVGQGAVDGGVTSGLSHLLADMYEIENSASRAARLIVEVASDPEALVTRRAEIIGAIDATAKPYFGDLEDMTYAEVLRRFAELSYPFTDPSWAQRFFELAQRVEARLSPQDSGELVSMFDSVEAVADPAAAIDKIVAAYPDAERVEVTTFDAAWFVELCRKYPKPVPFVSIIDADLLRSWGTDGLWQSHDPRYTADQVRIIPGPVSVAGITTVNEPVATILARYEDATIEALGGEAGERRFSRAFATVEDYLRGAENISWHGHVITNPARVVENYDIVATDAGYDMVIHLDTLWDGSGVRQHAVRELRVPFRIPAGASTGAIPVVDDERLPAAMFALLAVTAGVGAQNVLGDHIGELPAITDSADSQFGEAHYRFSLRPELGALHAGVTADLPGYKLAPIVPSAVLGMCWPSIYAALGSAFVGDYPVIEGLLNAVHLDHTEDLDTDRLAGLDHLDARSRCTSLTESSSGRVVVVETELSHDGERVGAFTERFAIRGRVFGTDLPADPPYAGEVEREIRDTPRSLLRRVTVTAPADMTPFAMVSGDYNPIHTSYRAAKVAGMDAPLVHGMWLCAAAQHAVSATGEDGKRWHIAGWTYRMYGTVDLNDEVEISVERVGAVDAGGLILEVTCRVNKNVVSVASAHVTPAVTAYVYPGQGVQSQGMTLDERATSPAARDVWERADAHTRSALGFSILTIVRDNPTEIIAGGVAYRHPQGVLNLTQFTQVALATVAFAQSERLREAGVLVEGAYLAGHSLGEYNALSAYAGIFPLETVIEIVFHRGSTMHNLVPRDAEGRSNYQMAALRPNQFGVGDADVAAYVASIAEASGEFIEIVNYNLAGEQYSIAGTVAGLAALAADAERRTEEAGGRRPFMLVPGIDVPFHSSVLRGGVADFRELLQGLLPEQIDPAVLVGRYIPNLVARPFELTADFLDSILEVVPADSVRALRERWDDVDLAFEAGTITRELLVELLAWQFASPVRWIETQDYLFTPRPDGAGVESFVEVGLGAAPTLANLAAKTLAQPRHASASVAVANVQRDAAPVYFTDQAVAAEPETADEIAEAKAQAGEAPATQAPVAPEPTQPAPEPHAAPAQVGAATASPEDLAFAAADAITVLLAESNKINLDQVGAADTVESLTNGVSSKRNQVLMDMSAELGLTAIDGAADASVAELSATVNKLAHNYKPFGPVLSDAIGDRLRKLFGAAGVKPDRVGARVREAWALGHGWGAWTTAVLLLETREGKSARGGELAGLPGSPATAAEVDSLIDAAVERVGALRGVNVVKPSAGGASGGVVDSAALDAFSSHITTILADNARDLLARLGDAAPVAANEASDEAVVEAVSAEFGANWVSQVAPAFDAKKAVLLNDRWASAREDLARFAAGAAELPAEATFVGTGAEVARQAEYYADIAASDADRVRLLQVATTARDESAGEFSGKVAVVTGMTPESIGGGVVARLLAGGATVIATASRVDQARLLAGRKIYRENARGDAALWLVPANLASYRDIDALVDWIGNPVRETVGGATVEKKSAMIPDLLFPFAAPRVFGMMSDAGGAAEIQTRLMLWGVERLLTGLAAIGADTVVGHRLHAVLPGSPNRGTFGGDGAYGEVKAAFDAVVNKWHVEPWAQRVSLAHARIGWVRGTGLMGGNDPLVAAVEERGVRTWSTSEIAGELIALATDDARERAASAPIDADLTGGLSNINLAELTRQIEAAPAAATSSERQGGTISALPRPQVVGLPEYADVWGSGTARPEDTIVIVGVGEVGPWGSARTRHAAELGIRADGDVDLTAAGVLELAWMTGLLTWHESPKAGWYDAEDNLVPEEEIFERYRDEVVARSGIRRLTDDGPIQAGGTVDMVTVFLDKPVTFTVATEAEARAYEAADPQFTQVAAPQPGESEWSVTRIKGATALVPRKTTLSRFVAGQLPTDFDPTRWGIPQSMVESVDKMAVWNLLTTVDAFISAGFTPAELLAHIHPTEVGSTQGTGFGGMSSMRKLFVERFRGEDIPQDILQETLPNVVAAHTMQTYVGGYGAMVQPVAACASAAVSLEDGVDKIAAGKAKFVVTGAVDDLSVESLEGFGFMNATADSASLEAQGIADRFFSRAGDLRRGGFVEAMGGGTVLIARGDLALEMGLPVYGVVGYVQTFADGAHTSIPAPGLGALAAGLGGRDSRLARQLEALGASVDDVAVLSKHDTSTNANDPNEAELHVRLARALGRSAGNPLHVISQKTLTGHSKGGAALFQIAGLTEVLATGVVPGNRSLDNLDPVFAEDPFLVWLREPLDLGKRGQIKAAMATSLGFGHVSSLLAILHPGAFEAAIRRAHGCQAADAWRAQAEARLKAGARHLEQGMVGNRALFEPIASRRFGAERPGYDPHEVEAAMLLDPAARLGEDGLYA